MKTTQSVTNLRWKNHIKEGRVAKILALCAPVPSRIMEKERVALLPCQAMGEHRRLAPQKLCPLSLVSRERLHSQAGVCDKDEGSDSLVFFLL